tara:strand:- start:5291 stop:5740 length:450 start_codon:yes stop_codon:yes gene_type:complete
MAIWQYSFLLIPRTSFSEKYLNFPFDKEGLLEDDIYWDFLSVNIDFFSDIETIMIKRKSWSENIVLFGNEEANCLEIYKDNNKVKSVSFRIDFTSDYEGFLRGIIEFSILKNLLIVDEAHHIIDPNYFSINSVIESSPQFIKYKQLSSK